jgi:hypothetical protein
MGLFGDDSDVEFIDTRTDEQKLVSRSLQPYLTSRIGRGLPRYTGQRVAGVSPFERQSLGLLGELMESPLPPIFGEAETALGPALSGEPTTEISPEITEEFYRTSIFDPAFRDLQDVIIPEIEGQYAGNFYSSARADATTEAITDFGEYQAALLAELQYADEQARRGLEESAAERQLAAVGPATELGQVQEATALGRIQAGQTFGALPRLLEQARLDAAFDEFIRTLPEYNPVIGQSLSFLGLPGMTAVVDPGTESGFGDILTSAAMLGAGYLSGGGTTAASGSIIA